MRLLIRCLPSVVTLLAHTGAISVLTRALDIFILLILFRHHICEVHISHLWKNSLAKYRRPKEGSLCPSAESMAFRQAWSWQNQNFGKIQQEKAPGWPDGSWSIGIQKESSGCGTFALQLFVVHWMKGTKLPPPLTWFLHVFSWSCLYFRSSYCISSELYI